MKVAVVITSFEEGPWLEGALQSVLGQDGGDETIAEVVLADDGSGPATRAVLDRLDGCDRRLRILRGPGGAGVSANRNRGVAASTAPLLAFLDGDDLWRPAKLRRQLAALEGTAGCEAVYTGYEALADGADAGPARPVYDLMRHRHPARRYFLHDPPVLPSSLLVRREALAATGGFDPTVPVFEDTLAFLRLAARGGMKGLAEPLVAKRYRAGSLSAPRPELMAHHARVAFLAAADDPSLAPLVGRRLGERAARLGLVAYYAGDLSAAKGYAALARSLHPLGLRTLALQALAAGGPRMRCRLGSRLEARAELHGR